MGYYCPTGHGDGTSNPCAAGTFNNLTERYQVSDCINCMAG